MTKVRHAQHHRVELICSPYNYIELTINVCVRVCVSARACVSTYYIVAGHVGCGMFECCTDAFKVHVLFLFFSVFSECEDFAVVADIV